MIVRKVAVAVFVDLQQKLYMQIRGNYSKSGEKYGFFGGGIEERETKEEAFVREIKEELDWTPDNYVYKTSHRHKNEDWDVTLYAFLVNLKKPLEEYPIQIKEGNGIHSFALNDPESIGKLHEMDRDLIKKIFDDE